MEESVNRPFKDITSHDLYNVPYFSQQAFVQCIYVPYFSQQAFIQCIYVPYFSQQALSGTASTPPRWQSCAESVKGAMPEVVGRLFVDEAFKGGAKEDVSCNTNDSYGQASPRQFSSF